MDYFLRKSQSINIIVGWEHGEIIREAMFVVAADDPVI